MTDRVIYVLGTPSGGTSCVAGILHHLGVDMGDVPPPGAHRRPYPTFEDRRCARFKAEPTEAQKFIMQGGGRDFRAYLEMRLVEAKKRGTIPGVKIGSAYWLGDPDPASLPVTIVKVDRPLEDSIRSDWRYQQAEYTIDTRDPDRLLDDQRILRAAQMAGYWMAKERLCEMVEPTVTVDFYKLLAYSRKASETLVHEIAFTLGLEGAAAAGEFGERASRACDFVNPEMRNV